jgi:hypothetical protein
VCASPNSTNEDGLAVGLAAHEDGFARLISFAAQEDGLAHGLARLGDIARLVAQDVVQRLAGLVGLADEDQGLARLVSLRGGQGLSQGAADRGPGGDALGRGDGRQGQGQGGDLRESREGGERVCA